MCVLQANDHCHLAWNNFANLMGRLDSVPCHNKGKCCESPVSVHDNLDLGILGFAKDNAGDGDLGEDKDKEDGEDEDEDDDDDDKDGDKDRNGGSAMDMS